jgi:multimeric flavodoxin WrbA
MAKIIGICGSTRKNATEYALRVALEEAEKVEGIEVELISLRGKKINPCIHCDKCIRDEFLGCAIYQEDDMNEIFHKCVEAEGLIMASPVFEMGISPQLSAFMSRFRSCYLDLRNDPEVYGKHVGGAIAVGGTRNGGQEMTIACMHNYYHTHGYVVTGGALGVYAGAAVWSQDNTKFDESVDPIGIDNARKLGGKVARTVIQMHK